MVDKGIEYKIERNSRRAVVNQYATTRRIGFRDLSVGATKYDVSQLAKKDVDKLIADGLGSFKSQFTIGIEIEKSEFSQRDIREYALFAGLERDGSCGVEGVTNIIPLLPPCIWRNKVYNMMYEAKNLIEDSSSPSDYRCGGHMTIGAIGLSGADIHRAIRKNMGIVYALFRKRLSNYYCSQNLFMDLDFYSHNQKYQPFNVKNSVIEVRLIARFQSVKQLMRRYELMYEIMNFSINNPNGSHSTLMKRVRPIIKSMYGGDEAKADEIISLANSFRRMLVTRKINRDVYPFVIEVKDWRGFNTNRFDDISQHLDRDLLRNPVID